MMIADLPIDERPREKLLMHGADVLTETDLLTLLLGAGNSRKGAVDLARELLKDGLPFLTKREVSELAGISGMGTAKATRLVAAFEIARRLQSVPYVEPQEFSANVLGEELLHTWQHDEEQLGAAFLNTRGGIIAKKLIFKGTVYTAYMSPREIVKTTLVDYNAVGIVLFHNHPSGSHLPSAHDITYTQKLKDSLELCGIELKDHLIIGAKRFYSMKAHDRI
jgi:DNA repair protein RadC